MEQTMEPPMNMSEIESKTLPLATLHDELKNEENNWISILRKNMNLKLARSIFKRKLRKKLNYRHMSTFLVSSNFVLKVHNTVVMNEVDKLSESLMSSRNNFRLRKIKPKRKIEKLKDCYMSEDEIKTVITQIFTIFRLENHIGPTNCANMFNWIWNTLKIGGFQKMSNFVFKEASFARAFRVKTVLKNQDPASKRTIQMSIVNNLRGALCWWTLAAFRQVMIPIKVETTYVHLWRSGYLNILGQEMKDFRERYKAKRVRVSYYGKHYLKNPSCSTITSSTVIGCLKCSIIDGKLRPIFRNKTKRTLKETYHWKRVNSMLAWCLKNNEVVRPTIKDSCNEISNFLVKNSNNHKIFAYTADITKCFSTVKHRTLICIIERLLAKRQNIWTVCGKGQTDSGHNNLLFCSGDSESAANEALRQKMKATGTTNYTVKYTNTCSTVWLLNELRTTISSYYFKRGKTIWKVTKGVPQGHPLSSVLACLYLDNFEKENWRNEKKDPRIVYCRYEDDYIFITTEKSLFKKMAKPLFTGRNNHSITANREKCKKSGTEQKLVWCGVKMDLKNLQFFKRKRCSDGVTRSLLINF